MHAQLGGNRVSYARLAFVPVSNEGASVLSRLSPSCFVFLFTFCVGCGQPFFLLPGGELDGPTAPTPADWVFTDEISTVQVETRPDDPYSINIWAVGLGDQLYLHAGGNRTTWVENLEVDPNVRVAVDGTLYELTASRVEDAAEFAAFADAYDTKYGLRPRNENIDEIYVYRLHER
jgi:hypothetical protein